MGLLRRVRNLYKINMDEGLRKKELLKAIVLPGYPTTTVWQINRWHREEAPESYPGWWSYVKTGVMVQSAALLPQVLTAECVHYTITKYL